MLHIKRWEREGGREGGREGERVYFKHTWQAGAALCSFCNGIKCCRQATFRMIK